MPTPVTVTIQVDATGAIRGSQQAQQAITSALNTVNASATKVGASTQTASRFLERFGDAPKRGISALDALNSTIIQATGGFQGLGIGASAAVTGLRAALFAMSSFLGPVGTITAGVIALGGAYLLLRDKTISVTDAVKGNTAEWEKFASGAGPNAAIAAELLAQKFERLTKAINERTVAGQKDFTFWEGLLLQLGAITPAIDKYIDRQGKLKEETLALQAELDKQNVMQGKAVAWDIARSSSAAEHAQAIINARQAQEGWNHILELYGQFVRQAEEGEIARVNNLQKLASAQAAGLAIDQQLVAVNLQFAKTEDEIREIYQEQISLIQERTAALVIAADTEIEKQNARKQGELEIARLNVQQIEGIERFRREGVRAYQEAGQAFAQGLIARINEARGVMDLFRIATEEAIKALIRMAAQDFFEKVLGGGSNGSDIGVAGVGVNLPFVKPSMGGSGRTSAAPVLSLPSAGGDVTNINISVHALDTQTLTAAVRERVIPIIENAAAGRRTRIALN